MSVVTVNKIPFVLCRLYHSFLNLLSVHNNQKVSHLQTITV